MSFSWKPKKLYWPFFCVNHIFRYVYCMLKVQIQLCNEIPDEISHLHANFIPLPKFRQLMPQNGPFASIAISRASQWKMNPFSRENGYEHGCMLCVCGWEVRGGTQRVECWSYSWNGAESNFSHLLFNSLRPSDAYMRQETKHHWFR